MKRFLRPICRGVVLLCPLLALILFCFCIHPHIALAHSELIASNPAPGETAGTDLNEIRLEFSEPVSAESQILLFTNDFVAIPLTTYHDTFNPNKIYAPVSNLRTGSYIVQWTAVSQDGHQIEGSFQFRVINPSYLIHPANLLFILSLVIFGAIIFFWRRNKS